MTALIVPAQIKNWLYFAGEDLKMARLALREEVHSGACFHAQQAVEKALKALLLLRLSETPRIHSLTGLLDKDLSVRNSFSSLIEKFEFLDQFYIPTRYPDAFPGSLPHGLPNKRDAETAVGYADELLSVLEAKIYSS